MQVLSHELYENGQKFKEICQYQAKETYCSYWSYTKRWVWTSSQIKITLKMNRALGDLLDTPNVHLGTAHDCLLWLQKWISDLKHHHGNSLMDLYPGPKQCVKAVRKENKITPARHFSQTAAGWFHRWRWGLPKRRTKLRTRRKFKTKKHEITYW